MRKQLDINYGITEEKRKQIEADKKAKDAAKNIKSLYKGIGDTITSGIHDAIMGAIDGTKTLGEVASGILKDISSQLLKFALGSFGGGGILGAIGGMFRADGGPVSAGKPYIVGERGPEVFTPKRTGTIIPNDAMGGSTSIVVNVDASGSSVEGDEGGASQLGKMLGSAIQAELVKQKRPGGLLAT